MNLNRVNAAPMLAFLPLLEGSPLMFNTPRLWMLCSLILLSFSAPFSYADTLEQIFNLAQTNDPEIRIAEAQLRANSQNRTISRAALLPQINAGFDRSENDSSSDAAQGNSDTTSETLSASLTQVLFDLPSWYNFKQGAAIADQAEKDYLAAKQDLIVRTTTEYLNVLRAIDTLATANSEERAFAIQLDQAKQRYDVGLTPVTDVYEAQAAYDDVIARLLLAEGNLGIAFEGLTVLTGQNHLSIAPLLDSIPVVNPVPEDPDEWVDIALDRSNLLASAQLNRDAARYNSRSSTLAHLPSLDLRLNYSDRTTTDNSPPDPGDGAAGFFDFSQENRSVVLSLNVPIFTGGRTTGQRRQAYYQLVQAEEGLDNTRRILVQTTRNLHLSARTGVSTVFARKAALTSSENALEATKAGYDVGTRNLVDLLQAERAVFAAQLDYFNSRYDYILDMLNLKLAAGTLSSEDLMHYNQYLDASGEIARSTLLTR